MGNVKDISGIKFGKWTVIDCSGRNKSGGAMWKCICDCGNIHIVDGRSLRNGSSTSCGCNSYYFNRNKYSKYKNGERNDRLYGIWNGIKDRCYNINAPAYKLYGGRGITVSDEWKNDYLKFKEWAINSGYDSHAPKGMCTLDRIDNNKGYAPDNCRWVTMKEQSNNRRSNHIIQYNGVSHTISEWSKITGIRKDTLRRRIEVYGWSIERAITEPNNHNNT